MPAPADAAEDQAGHPMRHLLTLGLFLLAPVAGHAADPRVGLRLAYGSRTSNVVEGAVPPVVERGKTTRVAIVGKDLGPGLDVWHSLSKGAITAKPVSSSPEKLVFDVTAAADAPVGVCGLRVATRDGLTNAVLFHVEELPVKGGRDGQGDRRTRGQGDDVMSLTLPACVWGTFNEGTLDRYTITVAAGERLSFEAVANRLGKDADPLLTIRDPDGRIVLERDNDPGLYFDFRFGHTFTRGGAYTLEVRDARLKASEHHHYVLRVGRFPAERVALPGAVAEPALHPATFFTEKKRPGDHGSAWLPVVTAEGPVTVARDFDERRDTALSLVTSPASQLALMMTPAKANLFQLLDRDLVSGRLQATPAEVPGSLCGILRKPGQRAAFAVKLEKGQRIFLRAESRELNSPADLEIAILDRTGREQRRAAEGPNGAEPALDFTANTPGEYGIAVRDTLRDGSDSHAFCVQVRSDPFPPTITADVEGLTVPQGSYQPVPLLVTRTGPPATIRLSLVGAPPGLRLTPSEIPPTVNSLVCKLEADDSAPLGIHTLRIIGESEKAPRLRRVPGGGFYQFHMVAESERIAVTTRPLIDKKLQNIDLIPIALREDQTRLPPSLTDRFAVQIVPPSPFTFELTEVMVTLARYQSSPIPIVTTRAAGFDGPISFQASGGQLAPKTEGRTRVFAEFPDATVQRPQVSGVVVSKILSNVSKARIDVTATGTHQGRSVSLTRTFDLDLVTAYRFPPARVQVALLPGESAPVRLTVERLKGFDSPITLHLSPMQGLEFPEEVTIPKGQTAVEFTARALPDAQARKQNLNLNASAEVNGFEEELRASPVEIEVKKVEVPKKK